MTVLAKTTLDKVLDTPFSAVISFGDSFSDNGFLGGHGFKRYTNTWTWAEYLSQMLGLPHDCWAWGGAMSDEGNVAHPPGVSWSGLAWQVREFTEGLEAGDDLSRVLFTVSCGSNDYKGGQRSGAAVAGNIGAAMGVLARAGARHFVYRESSAVLLAPGYLSGEGVAEAEGWRKMVNDINAATREVIQGRFVAANPGVRVYYLKSDPLFERVRGGEPGYGFEIVDKMWNGTAEYPEPHKYLWWDEWHLMGQAHLLIALETVGMLKEALK
ncbi:MAG: hypothetical protein LBF58_00630 [Deltaproteobacteria bacterium]|jgi:hypothetical protein|nr:hypothetical protein [Deltaproteobacteria bacterium]